MLTWFKPVYWAVLDIDRPEPPATHTPLLAEIVGKAFGPPDLSGVQEAVDPISQSCEAVAAVLTFLWKSLTGLSGILI